MIRPVMTSLFQLKRLFWRVRRPVAIGVRIAPIRGDGAVLMVQHTYLTGWYLPGGGAASGETHHDAAAPEQAEEAGLAAQHAPEQEAQEAAIVVDFMVESDCMLFLMNNTTT